jgi:ABC-type sugar transport system ATPase subunit
MSELELHGVSKRLGDHLAVDDVSFRVAPGEFLVLLGSSGSGKSTTLRMICGLEHPDIGTITLGGREISALKPRDRNLGMVFQEYGLYPAMDVRGNIAYGLEARKAASKDEIHRRVTAAAGKLGLTELLDRSTQELSGGEQQRVALARAMVKDADAYLFDEPLSNLDPKLRHRARRDILAVHRDKGRACVYVTHDQGEAFAMADRVAVMAHGRLQQVGTPAELLSAPANAFVARFVGDPPMNVVSAQVDGGSVRARGITLPLPHGTTAAAGSRVLAAFRPEAVTRAANGSPAIAGVVVGTEFGLTEQIVRFETADGTQLTAMLDGDLADTDVSPGDAVGFDVAGPVHLFDAVTELAIRHG